MITKTTVKIGENSSGADIHLIPGENLYTGEKPFIEEFGKTDSLEIDLFNLASGIYAADLAVLRKEREDHIRSIELTVEVINLHAFERIKDILEEALYTVSRDNWDIIFAQKNGNPANLGWESNEGSVLLFSGGLDSMCAASEFVRENKNLVLVSHNSHGNKVIDDCQNNVHKALEKHYSKIIRHIHIKVYGRNKGNHSFPQPNERENTQRTRSFLFLSLAALITRRCGFNKVLFMAENGQFAIHLPLNQARAGSFSTHTADPHFVNLTQEIFRTLLNNEDFQITNPFIYKTKAEVFALLPQKLKQKSIVSASCWKISRVENNKHCGFCIPCIARRISIEHNGIVFDEYDKDIFREDLANLADNNEGKRNLNDYLEFISRFRNITDINKNELLMDFPELSYNPAVDSQKALDLYERISIQSFAVFENYPNVMKLF